MASTTSRLMVPIDEHSTLRITCGNCATSISIPFGVFNDHNITPDMIRCPSCTASYRGDHVRIMEMVRTLLDISRLKTVRMAIELDPQPGS